MKSLSFGEMAQLQGGYAKSSANCDQIENLYIQAVNAGNLVFACHLGAIYQSLNCGFTDCVAGEITPVEGGFPDFPDGEGF